MSDVLEIESLCVAYGEVSALNDVTLSVNASEAVALVGANGAGKSTLFKSIVGFLRPRSGRLHFLGQDMTGVSPERRARLGLGYAPEGRRVFPGLTVRENLEVAVFGSRAERVQRLDQAFALFPQLAERQSQLGWQLSGGQQQMLAIGRALMGRPQLLLLDEPSLGLSPKLADEVLTAVKAIVRQGTAVLLAEQNVRKALACCDRAYVLEIGKVVLSGATSALRDTEEIRKAFLGA
ncbi:MAG: ABC transporter ATP-binding protein [Xanthobacteraceae bacterium]|jgi:branched-chain amino acid transport system ATP-binding protein